MTVRDVMTKRIATCRPDTNLAEATALMWENDCGVLPVIRETGELAGIVTDRDLCIALGTRNVRSSDLCVGDVLKDHTLCCKSSDDIHVALQTMRAKRIRRLPVVNEDARLEGILSMDDVVLNAEQDAKMGSVISYEDVVATLQAIYARDNPSRHRQVAA